MKNDRCWPHFLELIDLEGWPYLRKMIAILGQIAFIFQSRPSGKVQHLGPKWPYLVRISLKYGEDFLLRKFASIRDNCYSGSVSFVTHSRLEEEFNIYTGVPDLLDSSLKENLRKDLELS